MDFQIDRKEVLRYLQTSNDIEDENINRLIDESIREIKKLINFRYLYQKFPIEVKKDGVEIKNTTLTLKGKAIRAHLQNSHKIYLMAATIGSAVDKKISFYEKVSVTKSMIFDACATTAIEEGCDRVEAEIKKEVLDEGYKDITFRYSPGYGDLGIDIQREFLRILAAPKKIGLTASKYNLLQPGKSVTAVIGVLTEKAEGDRGFLDHNENKFSLNSSEEIKSENRDLEFEKRHCKQCLLYNDCELRRKGIYCGAKK
ncbi:MAG: Vitamin B12 dependent methionine synthase activation subunit [Bacillota bacterium]